MKLNLWSLTKLGGNIYKLIIYLDERGITAYTKFGMES